MQAIASRLTRQWFVDMGVMLLSLAMLTASWMAGDSARTGKAPTALLAVSLVAALVLSHQLPIHIRYRTKIYMGSVALYLMVTLLPPFTAALAVGVGTLFGELSVRSQKGGSFTNVASQTSRWIIVALLGSLVAHLGEPGSIWPLIGAAVVLWTGDIVTGPLTLAPLSGEHPWHIIVALAREAGASEAGQYLIGLLGALVAMQRLWALALLVLPTMLVYVTSKHAKELHRETRRVLENMADTVDARNPYTVGHSRRVADLTKGILRELPLYGPEADLIVESARVHDIGKIAVPDEVLRNAGPLTAEEQALMETHPERGADLLMRYPDFARGAEIIRHHHEQWDGNGYPFHLKGNEIPFGARVVAVANSFDIMTSDQPYRPAMTPQQAAAVLREGRGVQWDEMIVDAFLRSVAAQLGEPEEAALSRYAPDPAHQVVLRTGAGTV